MMIEKLEAPAETMTYGLRRQRKIKCSKKEIKLCHRPFTMKYTTYEMSPDVFTQPLNPYDYYVLCHLRCLT